MFAARNPRPAAGPDSGPTAQASIVEMAERGDVILIDVREHGEVAMTGKARGALHIPLMMVPSHCDPRHPECREGLSTDKPVALYCASGARSSQAAQVLAQLGYRDVTNIGGFHDWLNAGGQRA